MLISVDSQSISQFFTNTSCLLPPEAKVRAGEILALKPKESDKKCDMTVKIISKDRYLVAFFVHFDSTMKIKRDKKDADKGMNGS